MATVFGYLIHHGVAILGVLGFIISVYNFVAAVRNKTVNPQPQLLAELRGYLDTAARECGQVKGRLRFDRYQLMQEGARPNIPVRPPEFDDAIRRLPELGFTLTSVGQSQIELFRHLIEQTAYFWDNLRICLESNDPANFGALEPAQRLRRLCLIIEKFVPEYVDAVTDINKGNLWKRYKYRDHRELTYKVFRWTPLSRAVNDYETELVEAER